MSELKFYQKAELKWWEQYTIDELREERKDCFRLANEILNLKETTKGLDYGCGPISMFEGTEIKWDAIDPLVDEYRTRYNLSNKYAKDTKKKYSWVWCINVLDHDEDTFKIINDLKIKLKRGGTLYFEVNLTDNYAEPHPTRFKEEDIDELMKDFKTVWKRVVDKGSYKEYWAKYEN